MIKKAVLGVMTVGLLSLAPVAQSQASTQSADSVSAPQSKQRLAYVTGFVLNQLGDPQDDVNVEVFRAGDLDTPVASQLTYASVWDDAEPADHGFYNIELRFDPTLGNEFVVRFSSLPDAETQFRPYTYPKTFVAKGDYPYFDLPDVRMKLAQKVDSTTEGAVHLLRNGKPARTPTSEIPAGAKAVLPVTVEAGEPGILHVAGDVIFRVTQGRDEEVVEFEVTKGRTTRTVRQLTQALSPVKRTVGVSETSISLPDLAGSTATEKKICTKERGKRVCRIKKVWSSSETYTLHLTYSGSDEAKASSDTVELTVIAPERGKDRPTAPSERPNARL